MFIRRPKNAQAATAEELKASIELEIKTLKEKSDFQEKCRQEKMAARTK